MPFEEFHPQITTAKWRNHPYTPHTPYAEDWNEHVDGILGIADAANRAGNIAFSVAAGAEVLTETASKGTILASDGSAYRRVPQPVGEVGAMYLVSDPATATGVRWGVPTDFVGAYTQVAEIQPATNPYLTLASTKLVRQGNVVKYAPGAEFRFARQPLYSQIPANTDVTYGTLPPGMRPAATVKWYQHAEWRAGTGIPGQTTPRSGAESSGTPGGNQGSASVVNSTYMATWSILPDGRMTFRLPDYFNNGSGSSGQISSNPLGSNNLFLVPWNAATVLNVSAGSYVFYPYANSRTTATELTWQSATSAQM